MEMHVFVTRRFPGRGLKRLEEFCSVEVWEKETPPTTEEIIEKASTATGLITLLSDTIDRHLITSLPNLRVISQYAVGYNNIDIAAASNAEIVVTNTPGVLTETTADLTWALIMACARRIVEADTYVRTGKWEVAWGPNLLLGKDISGCTLGIVGMGRIGSAVARRAKGFDIKVLYTTRSISSITRTVEEEIGAEKVELDTLLKESDIVTLHVPLTESTEQLIDKEELLQMKKDAILINTSRGAVINEKALTDVVKSGHLFAVGLDVFESEPTPLDNPLLSQSNVVILPHIGSASINTRQTMGDICVDNLIAALSGRKPPNAVNPEVFQ